LKVNTSAHLDWLAFTYHAALSMGQLFPFPLARHPFVLMGPGQHGYVHQWKNDIGALLLTDGVPKQGIHVVMTGETLEALRNEGVSDSALCLHVIGREGKASRLDVALNLLEGKLTFTDLEAEYLAHRAKTQARAASIVKNLHTPEGTLYIGKRASERFLRAYNKGAQVGLETSWLRLELETKKRAARGLVIVLATNDDTRAVINSAIRRYVDFPDLPEYAQAVTGPDVTIPAIPRKMTATYRWLLGVCAPALANYHLAHPDESVYEEFLTAYQIASERHRRGATSHF
jgi:hypothetical protein